MLIKLACSSNILLLKILWSSWNRVLLNPCFQWICGRENWWNWLTMSGGNINPIWPGGGEEVQKCTGQKCTKHQLVLLTILKVLGPKKANNSWNSPQIDHRVLLAHSWTSGTKIWRRQIMVKSAKSTSSCFCFLSMLYVPYGVFELLRGSR